MKNRLFDLEQELARVKQAADPPTPTAPQPARSLSQSSSYLAEQLARTPETQLTPEFHYRRQDIATFVDNLFDPTFRPTLRAKIDAAITANAREAWLVEPGELQLILDCWLNIWKRELGAASSAQTSSYDRVLFERSHPSDVTLISYLARYVEANNLCLHEPDLEASPPLVNGRVRYRLRRYKPAKALFSGTMGYQTHIASFLRLLAAGAHFVVIHSPNDLRRTDGSTIATIPGFYDTFTLPYAWAGLHSHYTQAVVSNIRSAMVYPDFVSGDQTPYPCPFIVALLIGRTAWHMPMGSNHNTFFQLEGWPATSLARETVGAVTSKVVGTAPTRHMQDFATHDATKWNISTYGACPYSEKRGATVFLAPQDWDPTTRITPATIMASYTGAKTPQPWLDTTLVVGSG